MKIVADSNASDPNSTAEQILNLKVERADGHYSLENYQQCESIGFLLKRSFGLLSSAIDQQLMPFDLTHPQFSILMLLKQQNCSTAAELARESYIDTGAITRMLDRLEAKQYIQRERSSADRRVVNISLTELGKLVVDKMPVIAINVLNDHLQDFTSTEITQFKTLLRKLLQSSAMVAAQAEENT